MQGCFPTVCLMALPVASWFVNYGPLGAKVQDWRRLNLQIYFPSHRVGYRPFGQNKLDPLHFWSRRDKGGTAGLEYLVSFGCFSRASKCCFCLWLSQVGAYGTSAWWRAVETGTLVKICLFLQGCWYKETNVAHSPSGLREANATVAEFELTTFKALPHTF